MTNEEYIRKCASVEELASMLVGTKEVDEGDEDFDGEYQSFFITYYTSPNGNEYLDYDDAVNGTVEWLREEMEN